MKENVTKVMSAYSRYISSLKDDDCNVKENYNAMVAYVDKYLCDQSTYNLSLAMKQDCYINALRASHGLKDKIAPGYSMEKFSSDIESYGGSEMLVDAYTRMVSPSCLPLLYQYFCMRTKYPSVATRKTEVEYMMKHDLITKDDYWAVVYIALVGAKVYEKSLYEDDPGPEETHTEARKPSAEEVLESIKSESEGTDKGCTLMDGVEALLSEEYEPDSDERSIQEVLEAHRMQEAESIDPNSPIGSDSQ